MVIGAVVGALWPQGQVRALEAEVASLQSKECVKEGGAGRELARILHGGNPLGEAQREPSSPPPVVLEDETVDLEEPAEEAELVEPLDGDRAPRSGLFDADSEEMAVMAEAMEMRRRSARQALLDQAGAEEDQLMAIDGAVDAMNADLKSLATEFMNTVADGERPSRRDLMSFSADALDVFITAEDAFTENLDLEQIEAAAAEATDPMQYIDPEILRLVEELRP